MALLGHTIVETGLARLSGLWQQSSRSTRLRLRKASQPNVDRAALATATAIYAGEISLSAEEFSNLSWLPIFAGSGRQLLMCHALSLLDGWMSQRHEGRSLQQQTDIVKHLARSAGAFAAALESAAYEPLCLALQTHIQTLLAIHCTDPDELLTKATTLIEASRVIEDGAALTREAAKLLSQALPDLVALDGGPRHHQLHDYVRWMSYLLDAEDVIQHPASRNAVDRARPFLSMLLQHDLTYCFSAAEKIHPAILATAPMRLARTSGVVRLSAGKTVVISLPEHLNCPSALHVSGYNSWLMNAGHFQSGEISGAQQNRLSSTSSVDGELLQQVTGCGERTVFLSPKGDDLRIEDLVAADGEKRWMHLSINPSAKLSVTRNGTVATLAMDGRNLWQLTVRGAKILPIEEAGTLIFETATQTGRINWALKRVTRSPSRGTKSESLELPF